MKLSDRLVRAVSAWGDSVLTLVGSTPGKLVEAIGYYLAADAVLRDYLEKEHPGSASVLRWVGIAAAVAYLLAKPFAGLLRELVLWALSNILYRAIYHRDPIAIMSAFDSSNQSDRLDRLVSLLSKIGLKNKIIIAERMDRDRRVQKRS